MNLYPKTKKGQEKFNKIIESSIETIAKLGYSNASVGEITRNAGVSYGLFYLYFRDKDDLLDELVKKYNQEKRKYIHDTISGIEGRISIEKAGFHAFIDWVKGNTYLFQILLEAEIHRPEIYKWHYRMLGENYSKYLEEAMDRGEIRKRDPLILAYSLMGTADFLARRFILWDDLGKSYFPFNETDSLIESILKN